MDKSPTKINFAAYRRSRFVQIQRDLSTPAAHLSTVCPRSTGLILSIAIRYLPLLDKWTNGLRITHIREERLQRPSRRSLYRESFLPCFDLSICPDCDGVHMTDTNGTIGPAAPGYTVPRQRIAPHDQAPTDAELERVRTAACVHGRHRRALQVADSTAHVLLARLRDEYYLGD